MNTELKCRHFPGVTKGVYNDSRGANQQNGDVPNRENIPQLGSQQLNS